jgi:hypothetical protein
MEHSESAIVKYWALMYEKHLELLVHPHAKKLPLHLIATQTQGHNVSLSQWDSPVLPRSLAGMSGCLYQEPYHANGPGTKADEVYRAICNPNTHKPRQMKLYAGATNQGECTEAGPGQDPPRFQRVFDRFCRNS